MNLFALLDQAASRYPSAGAVFEGCEIRQTYAELRSSALSLAGGLARSGDVGDRIVVASKNCPEILPLMFGVWAAGMVFAPVNAKLHPREMSVIIDDADARWIFASIELADRLRDVIHHPERVVTIGSAEHAALFRDVVSLPVDTPSDALAWLFYTSGTTGRSKGAMLTHRNLFAMTASHLADFEDLSSGDSIIHAAPMSHGSGLYILPYVARAARHILPASGGFDATEFLDLCDNHPGCGTFLAPTMVQRLRTEVERTGRHPSGLRAIAYGGGPMYLDEIKRSLACFGPIFRQLYGQGECPMTITGLRQCDFSDRSDALLGSVGWPRTGVEVRIVDEEGRLLPAGEIGEIICRGDIVMTGYWRNPEATAATLRRGWLHTGDVGCFDNAGRLTLKDRSKDVIISGGTNIYPREVEEVLLAHSTVQEAAVIGRPDDEWGESVVAFVVPEAGAMINTDELDRHCIDQIARFKRPKAYFVLDSLPKSSYGKILKRDLAGILAEEVTAIK